MSYKDPEKQRAYQQNWYKTHKDEHLQRGYHQRRLIRQWIFSTKRGKTCIKCGLGDVELLDYHHRDPATKCFKISDAPNQTRNKEKIIAEIAKCDLLCSHCHRKLHSKSAPIDPGNRAHAVGRTEPADKPVVERQEPDKKRAGIKTCVVQIGRRKWILRNAARPVRGTSSFLSSE
jgi:hypothetical protein